MTGLVGALTVVLLATSASAGGAEVTSGEFEVFAAGIGSYDVDGRAQMVRTPSGKTIVSVVVSGLAPGAIYGSHVHKQACADGDAGVHYSFGHAVPGGALDGSEIWPGPFTANAAGRAVGWTSVGDIAGEDAVSVVIHAPGGAKIGCADLS
ncbi:MAG: hypothetical protein WD269_03185 [Acidimicrobiia bacterium]